MKSGIWLAIGAGALSACGTAPEVDRKFLTGSEARKGVVLATGGYGANPEMSWRFEQLPGFAHEASGLMPASLTGDGLVLGAEIGGILHKVVAALGRPCAEQSRGART